MKYIAKGIPKHPKKSVSSLSVCLGAGFADGPFLTDGSGVHKISKRVASILIACGVPYQG
jgi:hypothetical protein